MTKFYDQEKENERMHRLDYCECCDSNFMGYKTGSPMQRYGDEWMVSMQCGGCEFQQDIPASDKGIDSLNQELRETALQMKSEEIRIQKMSADRFTREIARAGLTDFR